MMNGLSNWLSMNGGNLVISVVLVAVVALIVRHIYRNKKAGRSSCGCACGQCAMKGACHSKRVSSETAQEN
ncbi:MAG: FeoB-associated Cys-rich membrane protein [Lachnospiraceae bacterium]|nr:FeoB-associated Cys-rich membrane protein [Lachnospiraceae bacterium]